MAYASAFLLPPDPERRPPALDPRRRVAADLYNRGLTEGFGSADGKTVELKGGVVSHSIISVDGDGPAEDGDDGVVEYESAHVDFTDFELVVNSGHSCQDNPHTIGEVRRILLEHLAGQ